MGPETIICFVEGVEESPNESDVGEKADSNKDTLYLSKALPRDPGSKY